MVFMPGAAHRGSDEDIEPVRRWTAPEIETRTPVDQIGIR